MTTEERLEKLENELSRVKRRNRWLLMGAALCLGIGLAAWAFGPGAALAQPAVAVPKEVRANSFVLEDANGKNRAALVVSKSGVAVLCLIDENGKARAALSGDVNGPGLRLFDEKGMCRSMLYVDMEGAWLDLRDEKNAPRATLYSDAKGPALILSEEGAPRAALYSVKEGGAPTLGESRADTDLRSKLCQEILRVGSTDLDFKDMMAFVKNYLATSIEVNWTTLGAAGIKPSTKVIVKDERNVTVARFLSIVLDYVSRAAGGRDVATYIIEDGILKVSMKSDLALKPRRTVAMRLYDEKGKRIWSAPDDEKGKPAVEKSDSEAGILGQVERRNEIARQAALVDISKQVQQARAILSAAAKETDYNNAEQATRSALDVLQANKSFFGAMEYSNEDARIRDLLAQINSRREAFNKAQAHKVSQEIERVKRAEK